MAEVLEIFRRITEEDARLLSDSAIAVAKELGVAGSYTTLKWGPDPRIGIAFVHGKLVKEMVSSVRYQRLLRVIAGGGSAQPMRPVLAVCERNLPTVQGSLPRNWGYSGLDLTERQAEGRQRVVSRNLCNEIVYCSRYKAHYPHGMDNKTHQSMREKTMRCIPLLDLDPNRCMISQDQIDEELDLVIPAIELGFVELEITRGVEMADRLLNYGYLESPGR